MIEKALTKLIVNFRMEMESLISLNMSSPCTEKPKVWPIGTMEQSPLKHLETKIVMDSLIKKSLW